MDHVGVGSALGQQVGQVRLRGYGQRQRLERRVQGGVEQRGLVGVAHVVVLRGLPLDEAPAGAPHRGPAGTPSNPNPARFKIYQPEIGAENGSEILQTRQLWPFFGPPFSIIWA